MGGNSGRRQIGRLGDRARHTSDCGWTAGEGRGFMIYDLRLMIREGPSRPLERSRRTQSKADGIGLPHSRTRARVPERVFLRKVLECGSPMPLFCMVWLASAALVHAQQTHGVHEIDLPATLR